MREENTELPRLLKQIEDLVKQRKKIDKQFKAENSKTSIDYLNNQKIVITSALDRALKEYHSIKNKTKNLNSELDSNISLLMTDLSDLNLSYRTYNSLRNEDIFKIGDLIQRQERDLLRIPNFGQKSLQELREVIGPLGLNFSQDGEEIQNFNNNKNNLIEISETDTEDKQDKYNPFYYKKIEDLNISVRTANAMRNININYIGELVQKTEQELMNTPNFGRNSLEEINELLRSMNLSLSSIWHKPPKFVPIQELAENNHQSVLNIKTIFGSECLKIKFWDLPIEDESSIELIKILEHKIEKNFDVQKFIEFDENLLLSEHNGKILRDQYIDIKKNIFNFISKKVSHKIFLNPKSSFKEIEIQMIKDLENWINSLKDKEKIIIKKRLGYMNEISTLEVLGKEFKVTRERIRQIESKGLRKIDKYISFDIDSLRNFLKRNEKKGFSNIFPEISSFFNQGRVGQKKRDIQNNNFNFFLEKYCRVDPNFFLTPDKVALELINNIKEVKNLFKSMQFPISHEDLSYEIATNLGYEEEIISQSISYIVEKKILVEVNQNSYYPYEITKKDEILSILNNYPKGIHQKDLFKKINASPSKVSISNFHGYAIQGAIQDISDTMFCGKGSIKLSKFGNTDLINVEEIFPKIVTFLDSNSGFSTLDFVFDHLKNSFDEQVDMYDLRYVIKLHGERFGIYFSGKSQGRTISLGKPISINRSQEIEIYINKQLYPNSIEEIASKLNINEGVVNYIVGDLVQSGKLCRYAATSIYSNKEAYRNFNHNEIKEEIIKLVGSNKFITVDFLAEKLNDKYFESKSNYFYASYFFYLRSEFHLNINYHQDILSNNLIPKQKFSQIIGQYIDESLDQEANYRIVINQISITKNRFKRFFYYHYVYGAL